jgi:HipA-like protein
MLPFLKKFFSKSEGVEAKLPLTEKDTFVLKVDDLDLGILQCENGEWLFHYTDEFKQHQDEYSRIIGFSDLNKEYKSHSLWPFFSIRIPGLKQPAIREILKEENIDEQNEAALLRRFGRKTIANPYELLPA